MNEKVIILQEAKFYWTTARINQAKDLFDRGLKSSVVAEVMNEKVIDVGLLYLHLLDTGQLKR